MHKPMNITKLKRDVRKVTREFINQDIYRDDELLLVVLNHQKLQKYRDDHEIMNRFVDAFIHIYASKELDKSKRSFNCFTKCI